MVKLAALTKMNGFGQQVVGRGGRDLGGDGVALDETLLPKRSCDRVTIRQA
ncbi:hypothetical protein OG598_12095 [Micromonospora sp. NBC_00330]|uniref:hypothetical protein n=1 Tax=Micromonospora sp. NBC_00330 TaxID=2903585 RepID=UPI002E29E8FE|nr:hypothetical protein [Micromonospora sp. NBC_00330]